jgi:hypothetical protein
MISRGPKETTMIAIAITFPDGTKIAVAIKPPVKAVSQRPPIDTTSEPVVERRESKVA